MNISLQKDLRVCQVIIPGKTLFILLLFFRQKLPTNLAMGSMTFLFILLSLVLPTFLGKPSLVVGDMNLIKKTCKNTKYYELCVSSLKSNATSPALDVKGLAITMVELGTANATATSSYLSSQLLSSATNDTFLKMVLKECADKYAYAGNALQDSIQDLAMEAYDYASINVMAASDYPNACRNAFRRYPGLAYPAEIGRREDGLKHICDVILGIISSIQW